MKDKTWDPNYAIKQDNVDSSNPEIFPDLTSLPEETLHTKNEFLPLSNQSKENQTENDHVGRNITLYSGPKMLQSKGAMRACLMQPKKGMLKAKFPRSVDCIKCRYKCVENFNKNNREEVCKMFWAYQTTNVKKT